jgi:hypothetical protein
MRDTMDALSIPYRIFGFDSDMSEVVLYARRVDSWMRNGGRAQIAHTLCIGSRNDGVIGPAMDGRGGNRDV